MDDEKVIQAIKALPRERTRLLPALQVVQAELGFLPLWAMEEIGRWLRVPKSEVYGAATSYAGLRFVPPARHSVKVCCGASCRMNGSERLLRTAQATPGVVHDGSNGEGNFELAKTDCAFVCGVGPAVQIDGVVYGRMSEEDLVKAIDALRQDGAPTGDGEA